MGIPDRPGNLEIRLLKLTAEHFPLPGSVRGLVFQRYTALEKTALGMQSMPLEDVIGYLRNPDHLSLAPLASIQAQTGSIGDPAMPSAEQTAILEWLGVAFSDWETQFPMEEPLRAQLRRLKPLAATLAITDPDFLVPGKHPLHKLLDQLQLGAVGWQSKLGRAGQPVERQLGLAVEKAAAWFDTEDTDLEALSAEVTAATARDVARASRMARRLVEAELGRLKNAEAKRAAAGMINAALEQFGAPPSIGKLLKGPWYESAQLVLLKYGPTSTQWRQMSETTTTLLSSVQPPEIEEDPSRRQQIFEVVTRLPREMKRWLLSLQHDSDSVENAMGMLEYAHLQILRKEPLALEKIEPIPIVKSSGEPLSEGTLASIKADQWFSVDRGEGEPSRVRLVLRIESQGELIFANQAGIRVLQQSFEAFGEGLESGKVAPLDSGASFSRCLAQAAGMENTDDLEALQNEAALQTVNEEYERQRHAQLQNDREQADRLLREQEEAEHQQPETLAEPEPTPTWLQTEPLENEQQDEAQLQREWDEARRRQGRESQSPPAELETALPELSPDPDSQGPDLEAQADDGTKLSALDLPMGTWLGFHDGDTPIMAKLAVHDLENNNYTFVNRSGIKMRQLNQQELIALMENGLVDILVTRSSFRDQITRVKNQSED